ncbi:glycosyltransferase family 2 protein [Actomonas aquatica]|uniref:Glycosyltransferase family 2 protein n=1 Tax=Actomonas aquatica TaxID=2866162 RepID=A0ABZ1C4T5_9BACT|nr:glycosyltransferase family 2 protein [Opitutus sp. WL0086]WRQ86741.1 glycosyltransferase family 2 protein [Opitutus sp. WL0086]
MPAVSVLMVFHRDGPHLRPAIASVLAQTWRDFELVLVDNGSGLDASDLGELGQDARVRWVHLPQNVGIPGGHNAGVAAARAPWVALMDYDDVSQPERLARQWAAAQTVGDDVGVISGQAERINAAGEPVGQCEFSLGPDDATRQRDYAAYAGAWVTQTSLVRREWLTALPYREVFPFAADLDWQARASERGAALILPDVLLRYRWHDGQTTQARRDEIERSRAVILLISQRRRAGRDERLAEALAELEGMSAAAAWWQVAEWAATEGWAEAAAYAARRSWVLERGWRRAGQAVRLIAALPAAARARAWRMALRGPVRALGVRGTP